jgi:hypothetical protein
MRTARLSRSDHGRFHRFHSHMRSGTAGQEPHQSARQDHRRYPEGISHDPSREVLPIHARHPQGVRRSRYAYHCAYAHSRGPSHAALAGRVLVGRLQRLRSTPWHGSIKAHSHGERHGAGLTYGRCWDGPYVCNGHAEVTTTFGYIGGNDEQTYNDTNTYIA